MSSKRFLSSTITWFICGILVISCVGFHPKADLLIHNGTIYTLDEKQPTVASPIEPVVSRIDDPEYVFFDDEVEYCHCDFGGEIIDDSCIYLTASNPTKTIMLSKVDAIAIARKFNLTSLDLSC